MLREIVLDTETTGFDPKRGDRLVEIGCVEIVGRIPTGREYHCFLFPERLVPQDAINVHGLTDEFLSDKPVFKRVADEFLDFIGDAPLVIHNAAFDIGFLNMELERLKKPPISMTRVVDTLQLARRKHPAGPNTLDALCKRYSVDTSSRSKHGALIDSLLLANVYIELLGERQAVLGFGGDGDQGRSGYGVASGPGSDRSGSGAVGNGQAKARLRSQPLPARLSDEDRAAHAAFIETLGGTVAWKAYATPK
jgi:DNA polymerase III subunit epsilon